MRHARWMFGMLCLAVSVLVWIPLEASEDAITWVSRYDGPSGGSDQAYDIAIGPAGDIYVSGKSFDSTTSFDYVVLKFDPDGNLLWERRYDGPGHSDDIGDVLEIDAQGNIYVTGYSYDAATGSDFATLKYSADGVLQWVQRYDGPGHGNEFTKAMCLDVFGNVYITGISPGTGTDDDYATLKYAPDGTLLWVRRYDGPASLQDRGEDVQTDAQGNVYVTGSSWSAETYFDYATLKYDPAGNLLWERRYTLPLQAYDCAEAMRVDAAGNVYVTGYSTASSPLGSPDYLTIMYDTGGNLLWERRYNGPADGDDHAYELAIDDLGNAYVAGVSGNDCATLKYDSNGDLVWARVYDGFGMRDVARGVSVGADGSVFVTGWSKSGTTGDDLLTLKYGPDGNLLWQQRYNGPGNASDWAYVVRSDMNGDAYATGLSGSEGTDFDIVTIKYAGAACACPLQSDFDANGQSDAVDLGSQIDVVFFGGVDPQDPTCPTSRADFDCDGTSTALDLSGLIDHIFAGGAGPSDPCGP